jgi:hypothetical protein
MKSKLILTIVLFLCSLIPLQADVLHEPKAGSPERKAIMDGLRATLKANDAFKGKDVVFVVRHLKVHNGWAWVEAGPQDRKTGKMLTDDGQWLLKLKKGVWKDVVYPENLESFYERGEGYKEFVAKLRKQIPDVPADIFPKD